MPSSTSSAAPTLIALSAKWEQAFAESLIGQGEERSLAMQPSRLSEFMTIVRERFEQAARDYAACDMSLHAAIARWRMGKLVSGDEGRFDFRHLRHFPRRAVLRHADHGAAADAAVRRGLVGQPRATHFQAGAGDADVVAEQIQIGRGISRSQGRIGIRDGLLVLGTAHRVSSQSGFLAKALTSWPAHSKF